MYEAGDFDLAGFAVGAMERGAALPAGVGEGDVLLGLASDGVHSNGYSLVRGIVARAGLSWDAPAPFAEATLGAALLTPTRLLRAPRARRDPRGRGARAGPYHRWRADREPAARAAEGLGAEIDLSAWSLPPVFRWLAEAGRLDQAEMLRTFNAGIGMVLVVDAGQAGAIEDSLRDAGETVFRIGTVAPGECVRTTGTLA